MTEGSVLIRALLYLSFTIKILKDGLKYISFNCALTPKVRHPSTVIHTPSTISILASNPQKTELQRSPVFRHHQLVFADDLQGFLHLKADAYMDLMFEPSAERIEALQSLAASPIFVNSVIQPLSRMGNNGFIRINGWPGFLDMPLLEAAAGEESRQKAREVFGEYILFVKDVPGFVNPRIISMIINEAYYTLEAGTGSREEIDIAMKLGTGYPMGPFEWGEKIGLHNVYTLLSALAETDPIYVPAPGIVNEK